VAHPDRPKGQSIRELIGKGHKRPLGPVWGVDSSERLAIQLLEANLICDASMTELMNAQFALQP
jgi:hypothetical protein